MNRAVTERDLRAPEFAEGSPEDYEFRSDGKIVRKDRWERGMHSIAAILGCSRSFEISDLVEQVRAVIDARDAAAATNFCRLIDELIQSWNTTCVDTPEIEQRRINARISLEKAIERIANPMCSAEQ